MSTIPFLALIILMSRTVVNLLCILCSRIRTYRELLMIFFHDKHWYHSEPLFSVDEEEDEEEEEDEDEEVKEEAGHSQPATSETSRNDRPPSLSSSREPAHGSSHTRKTEYEFLLFNYLLRFVHREGQIGDFARAGLLFLMDVAMSPGEQIHKLAGEDPSSPSLSLTTPASDPITDAALSLAEYILDGDFSEVLGAGVGAVYSLLPSKLEIRPPVPADGAQGNSMVLGNNPIEAEEAAALEATREKLPGMGVEISTNPDFRSRLDHFLKLLEFLEDVFRRNVVHEDAESCLDASTLVGSAIVQSILDAFRRIFLENVLYPSILECSDADGSAVAVMSYIEIMIRTLHDGQLANLLVDFLMSEDNDEVTRTRQRPHSMLTLGQNAPPQTKRTDKQMKKIRRKSSAMVLLEMEAPDSRRQSEYFTSMGRFTLKDLLLSNLRSSNQPTAAAALQLLQSLLYEHNQLCAEQLLRVIYDPRATSFPIPAIINRLPQARKALTPVDDNGDNDEEEEMFVYPGADDLLSPISNGPIYSQPNTTYSTHEREMGLYLNLISRFDPLHVSDTFSTGYDKYLADALIAIQEYSSFWMDHDGESREKLKHRLNPNDPILSLVLESLRRFLSNTPEFNIALTGVLATLAFDANRSLAGWLTFGYKEEQTVLGHRDSGVSDPEDGDDRSIDYQIEEKLGSESWTLPASSLDDSLRPVVHTIFQGLVGQLERYRQLVDNFDKYLLERRQGLLFSENLTDALTLALDLDEAGATIQLRPTTPAALPETPQKPKPIPKKSNSFVSFLTPRKSKPTPSKQTSSLADANTPSKNVAASPFGPHYQQTGSIVVEPFEAPLPSAGPWTPAKPRKFNAEEEDVFMSGWGEGNKVEEPEEQTQSEKTRTVTLSQLLDNVVILEESIKELVAIIHARRSLGIDSVRYV